MRVFNLKKAIAVLDKKGIKTNRADLAIVVYGEEGNIKTKSDKINKVIRGHTASLTAEQIYLICDYFKCDPNFLLDWEVKTRKPKNK